MHLCLEEISCQIQFLFLLKRFPNDLLFFKAIKKFLQIKKRPELPMSGSSWLQKMKITILKGH